MVPSYEFKTFHPTPHDEVGDGDDGASKPKTRKRKKQSKLSDDFPESEVERFRYNSSAFHPDHSDDSDVETCEGESTTLEIVPMELWFPDEVPVEEVIAKRRKIKERIVALYSKVKPKFTDAKSGGKSGTESDDKSEGECKGDRVTTRGQVRKVERNLCTTDAANSVVMTDKMLQSLLHEYDIEFFNGKFWRMIEKMGIEFKLFQVGNEDDFFGEQKGQVAAYCQTDGRVSEIKMHSSIAKLDFDTGEVHPNSRTKWKPSNHSKVGTMSAYLKLCPLGPDGKLCPPHCGAIEAAIQQCSSMAEMQELVEEAETDLFGTEEVSGMVCRDRMDCIQILFEHEMIHLFIDAFQRKLKVVHGAPFIELAKSLFGHTLFTHSIGDPVGLSRFLVQCDKEKKMDRWRVGDIVAYATPSHHCTGHPRTLTKCANSTLAKCPNLQSSKSSNLQSSKSTNLQPTKSSKSTNLQSSKKFKSEAKSSDPHDPSLKAGGSKGGALAPPSPLAIILVKGKDKLTLISMDGSIVSKIKYGHLQSPDRPISKDETKQMVQWADQFVDMKKRIRVGSKVYNTMWPTTIVGACGAQLVGTVVAKKSLHAEVSFERNFTVPIHYHSLAIHK